MSEDSPSQEELRDEARRWLVIVEDDLAVAVAAANLTPPRLGAAAYHLQQAGEKLAKALLVLTGEGFRRTHDMGLLADRLQPHYPQFVQSLEIIRPLTQWSVAFRYPGPEDKPDQPPTIQDVQRISMSLATFAAEVQSLVGKSEA